MIALSPKLSRVVSDQALDCINGNLSLDKNEIDTLTKILSTKGKAKSPVNRKRAVNAFIQVAKNRDFPEVLAKILLDSTELNATRIAAASGLGKFADEESEKALIQALGKTNGHLQREVIKAMGRIGTEKSIKALDALSENNDPGFKHTLTFARIFIGYRIKGTSIDSEKIKEALGVQWIKLQSNPLSSKKLQENIQSLRDNTFGLKLSDDIGFEIMCGKTSNTLLLNDKFKPGALLKNLKSRSQISGIVAARNPKESISTVRNIVITNLSESGIDIIITRTTGEVVYAGDAWPEGELWKFTLRDIGLTSAPTTVTGTISDKEIIFEVSSVSQRRVKTGQRI
ncbi:MAG: HEAT repeat domain-containing protein [Gammaproteobacteria bacterium]|nr:HEAT repeat domain-containing protein [Gammaproteobacteria bacterium]